MKKYTYFVSFTHNDTHSSGFGNIAFNTNNIIEDYSRIPEISEYIKETYCQNRNIVILHFILLKTNEDCQLEEEATQT